MIEPKYLLSSSRNALREIHLKKLDTAANSRKKLRVMLDDWIEQRAEALAIEWLITYGEELLALLAEPPSEVPQVEPKPALKPMKFEFWRSAQRHARRRAG